MHQTAGHFLGIFIALLGSPAVPDGGTTRQGSIVGYVYGQTGKPLSRVKVTATAPGRSGGENVAYSDDKGAFALKQLRPGTFELRFTGPDLKTLVKKGVLVGAAAPSQVRVMMEVEVGGIEEVRVIDVPSAPSARRPRGPLAVGTVSNMANRRCHKITRTGRARHWPVNRDRGHVDCWMQPRGNASPARKPQRQTTAP